MQYSSWTRIYQQQYNNLIVPSSSIEQLATIDKITCFGNGRSYSNVACATNSDLWVNNRLNRIIDFDYRCGVITAESGCLLSDIIDLVLPHGWFLSVTPGTKFVTLAGAVANDVHGKNHHVDGSFGCSVINFELVRSSGEKLFCSREINSEYFYASIGGLGLTGWITTVSIQLKKVSSYGVISNAYKYKNLEEFFILNDCLEKNNTYTVAWIDCLAYGKNLGRGIYFTGEHAANNNGLQNISKSQRNFPIELPFSAINSYTLKALNTVYYNRSIQAEDEVVLYDKYFYPLDGLLNWNRIYGKNGFYQYQLLIPDKDAYNGIKEVLEEISKNKQGSFLAVLKTFSDISSGGLLSFPRKGVTLALDFANYGDVTLQLFAKLDEIVMKYNGALYCAKDGRMSGDVFKFSYPNWENFLLYKDPKFTSQFWENIIGE